LKRVEKKSYEMGDEFKEMAELNNFAIEEDKAINSQLDGEALVAQAGPSLQKEITSQVTNATPSWVLKKMFFKDKSGLGKDSLLTIDGINQDTKAAKK